MFVLLPPQDTVAAKQGPLHCLLTLHLHYCKLAKHNIALEKGKNSLRFIFTSATSGSTTRGSSFLWIYLYQMIIYRKLSAWSGCHLQTPTSESLCRSRVAASNSGGENTLPVPTEVLEPYLSPYLFAHHSLSACLLSGLSSWPSFVSPAQPRVTQVRLIICVMINNETNMFWSNYSNVRQDKFIKLYQE